MLFALAAACSGGNDGPTDGPSGPDARMLDGPTSAPVITSFTATPSQVAPGVATDVMWNWTYALEPTLPDPTCTIDNGVGAVTRGQTTSVTITAVTTFRLTCTNSEGMAARQVVVAVPPAAPVIATFTATPPTIPSGTPTNVTFAWTYANSPSPPPTCTIDGVAGNVTSGMATSLTLTTSRVYRLRCTNTQGTGAAVASVNIDECAANTDDCQANATCTDTADGYTCACNSGFTGNGDVCSAQVACGVTPTLCSPDAACSGGTVCVCNAGFVGDGTTCTRNRIAFTTSTTGNGNLSTWVGAGTNTGLAAADAVCQARAAAALLPGTYVAWMSDSISDAYCRVNGLTGKKATNCGQATLPVSAGPWVRRDGLPFAPTIDRLVAPGRTIYYPASLNESNVDVALTDRVYTGTDDNGVYIPNATCVDWTSSSSVVNGAMGEAHGSGGGSWTDATATTADPVCSTLGRLRCVQVTSGPPLPSRHPVAKKAFVTSVEGPGVTSMWADNDVGLTVLAAADAVCRSRARFAGYANSGTFKAWMSISGSTATTRILSNGPWARPDGVMLALSEADLLDGRLTAAIYQTELGTYLQGTTETGNVWTGTSTSGFNVTNNCSSWSFTSSLGQVGRHDSLDGRWTAAVNYTCSLQARILCLEDL
jgi:hypothetical protein